MGELLINHLHKGYPEGRKGWFQVLTDVTLTLHENECLSLIGSSGCGKSTLARLILGLDRPDKGEILIDNVNTSQLSFREWRPLRTKIQGVFQDASGTLNPTMSVYQNMQEALRNLTSQSQRQRKAQIEELMCKLNIPENLLQTPSRLLSGGEQRRVSLLRALVLRPKYVILDEVVSGLDLISKDAVLSTLEEYRNLFGCSYLFITHDMSSASRLSDRIIQMEAGKLKSFAIHT